MSIRARSVVRGASSEDCVGHVFTGSTRAEDRADYVGHVFTEDGVGHAFTEDPADNVSATPGPTAPAGAATPPHAPVGGALARGLSATSSEECGGGDWSSEGDGCASDSEPPARRALPPPPAKPPPSPADAALAAEVAFLRAENERLRLLAATKVPPGSLQTPTSLPAFRPPPGLAAPPAAHAPLEAACGPAAGAAPPSGESTAASADEDEPAAHVAPAERLPSVGSALHASGACKPCGWFWKRGGCQNGTQCRHCHVCAADELVQRRKQKLLGLKQQQARERRRPQARLAGPLGPSAAAAGQHLAASLAAARAQLGGPAPPGLQGQLSVGSALHASGSCKPCGWFWRPEGCQNGSECLRCHLCPPGELLRRKRDKQTIGVTVVRHMSVEEGGRGVGAAELPWCC